MINDIYLTTFLREPPVQHKSYYKQWMDFDFIIFPSQFKLFLQIWSKDSRSVYRMFLIYKLAWKINGWISQLDWISSIQSVSKLKRITQKKKWKEKYINEFIPQFYRYTILGEKMDVNFSFTVSEVRFQPYA